MYIGTSPNSALQHEEARERDDEKTNKEKEGLLLDYPNRHIDNTAVHWTAFDDNLEESQTRALPFRGATNHELFEQLNEVLTRDDWIELIHAGVRPSLSSNTPTALANVIKKAWHPEPRHRVSARYFLEVVESLFITDSDELMSSEPTSS